MPRMCDKSSASEEVFPSFEDISRIFCAFNFLNFFERTSVCQSNECLLPKGRVSSLLARIGRRKAGLILPPPSIDASSLPAVIIRDKWFTLDGCGPSLPQLHHCLAGPWWKERSLSNVGKEKEKNEAVFYWRFLNAFSSHIYGFTTNVVRDWYTL